MFEFFELLLISLTQGKKFYGLVLGALVGVIFTYPLFETFSFIFVAAMALIGTAIQFSIYLYLDQTKEKDES